MARGILYCMVSSRDNLGLVKIGKTTNFESRMREIEDNGYKHVDLKRYYAVEVDNFDEKETILHQVFSHCQLANSELFAVDKELVVSLMSSLGGVKVYPRDESNEEVFANAVENIQAKVIPNGEYYASYKEHKATIRVEDGSIVLLKGSYVPPNHVPSFVTDPSYKTWRKLRESLVENDYLSEDVSMSSVSHAGGVVLGRPSNGWLDWKTADGKPIDIFRNDPNNLDD